MFTLALQVVAVIAGLASAFFWWRSSEKPKLHQGEFPDDLGDGAQIVAVEGGYFIYDIPRQSRLNSQGALSAAISILAQAATVAFAAIPAI